VRYFLDAGAAASGENSKRRSALFYAHYRGHDACARLIEAAVQRVHLEPCESAVEKANAALEQAKLNVAASIAATKEAAQSAVAQNPGLVERRKRKREEEAGASK
jgi:hypothetical protein